MSNAASLPVKFSGLPDISREPRYSCRVNQILRSNYDAIILKIDTPQDFKFSAGQYIWLVLPERSHQKGIVDRRAYSIVSAPGDTSLEFYIRLTNSDYLQALSRLDIGNNVEIIGPMGNKFVQDKNGSIMIASGTGIAPFISSLRDSTMASNSTLVSFSKEENQPINYWPEIHELAEKKQFKFINITGTPLCEHFDNIINADDNRSILISGPQLFVNSVTEILLAKGIPFSQLSFEACYPSSNNDNEIHTIFTDIVKTGDIMKYSQQLSGNSQTTEIALRLNELFIQISEQTSNHVVLTDSNGIILYANEAAEQVTGYSLNEMRGQTPRLWGGLMSPSQYTSIWQIKNNNKAVILKVINRHKEGGLYTAIAHITPLMRAGKVFAYVATEEDVTELKNLNQTNSNLISMVAHRLKTPLTSINWNSEMLTSEHIGELNDEQKNLITRIHKASHRMIDSVDELLNVSRIDLGVVILDPVELDVQGCAEQILSEISTDTEKRKQTLEVVFEPNLPTIIFDEKYLQMIYQNLLSNASKYTQEGGKISLHVTSVNKGSQIDQHTIPGTGVLVTVADNGFGIPINDRPKIFGKMFRADNVRKTIPEGTGLGLYIIKSVVEQADGLIWFESEENKGSTFYIYLPCATKKTVS